MLKINTIGYSGFVKPQGIKQNTKNIEAKPSFAGYASDSLKLRDALCALNNVKFASSVSFTGNLSELYNGMNTQMVSCECEATGDKGSSAGKRIDLNEFMRETLSDDIFATGLEGFRNDADNTMVSMLKTPNLGYDFRFGVYGSNEPLYKNPSKCLETAIWERIDPKDSNAKKVMHFSMNNLDEERAYILSNKGDYMGIVQDGENVILLENGEIKKKDPTHPFIGAYSIKPEDKFEPFEVEEIIGVIPKKGGSRGGGGELVIAMQEGRFVPEIINSIATFEQKVNDGEIILDEFYPMEGSDKIEICMLAGGIGSRAEYANAASDRIFNGIKDGSNMTKSTYRTPTGLTPMETTFVTLHKAGLLDCSKGNLGIGKNIKFYLYDKGVHTGNGDISQEVYKAMKKPDTKGFFILPNDPISRMPIATKELAETMNSKDAALVMMTKEVPFDEAKGKLSVVEIGEDGELLSIEEKPQTLKEKFINENGNCNSGIFQFIVSKEAFEALDVLSPYLPGVEISKEAKDWSKTYFPIIIALTQNDYHCWKALEQIKKDAQIEIKDIPLDAIQKAQQILGNKKVYAVRTTEPWADCGSTDAMYDTMMKIAKNEFKVEPFERKNVLDCVNTKTGLVASTPEQKKEIEAKYDVDGKVFVVPKAEVVPDDILDKYESAITRHSEIL